MNFEAALAALNEHVKAKHSLYRSPKDGSSSEIAETEGGVEMLLSGNKV